MVETVPARMLWIVAGFTIWGIAFVVLYAVQGIGCSYAWPPLLHRGLLGVLLALHLAAIGWLIARAPRRREAGFLSDVTVWTLWASLLATVVTYGPPLLVTACA